MEPHYSVLIYKDTLDQETIQLISTYLQKGIKVYLLSGTSKAEVEQAIAFLYGGRRNPLFVAHLEMPPREDFAGDPFFFFDGEIDDPYFYDWIADNSTFNLQQYEIEHSNPHEHCLVKAGAGTGKTRVMIDRLFYLRKTQDNLTFDQMAMFTFTNESALTMRKRLTQRLQDYFFFTRDETYLSWFEEVDRMQISTLHSFAKTLLQEKGSALGIPGTMELRGYQLKKRQLVEEAIHQYALAFPEEFQEFRWIPQYELVNSIMEFITMVEQRAVEDPALLDFGSDQMSLSHLFSYVLEQVDQALTRYKQENQQWEMADLIRLLSPLTRAVEEKETIMYPYLFVDEFQDTDVNQVRFLAWLHRRYGTLLFLVGDLKQSIYRFRGADYTAYQQMKGELDRARLNPWKEYALVKNYRTHRCIMEELHPRFSAWGSQVDGFPYEANDQLEAMIGEEGEQGLALLPLREDDTLSSILHQLNEKMKQEPGLECVLLVRTNEQVNEVAERAEDLGYLCQAEREGDFYRSLPVREFVLLLQVLLFPEDPLKRYLFHRSSYGDNTLSNAVVLDSFTPDKLYVLDLLKGETKENEWLQQVRKEGEQVPVFTLIREILGEVKPADRYALRLYSRLCKQNPGMDVKELQHHVRVKRQEYRMNLEWLLLLMQKNFPDAPVHLFQLLGYLETQMNTNRELSALVVPVQDRGPSFVCKTVHKAKGQEYDYVILPETTRQFVYSSLMRFVLRRQSNGTWQVGYRLYLGRNSYENQLYRRLKPNEEQETIAEEVRLFYVALTRAKKGLYVAQDPMHPTVEKLKKWEDLMEQGVQAYV